MSKEETNMQRKWLVLTLGLLLMVAMATSVSAKSAGGFGGGGPLVGVIIGSLLGAHERVAWPKIAGGVLIGSLLTLIYGFWHLYNAITGALGLDSLANLGLQLLMFVIFGSLLGLVIFKLTIVLRNSARVDGG
jgi:hypothetical protein